MPMRSCRSSKKPACSMAASTTVSWTAGWWCSRSTATPPCSATRRRRSPAMTRSPIADRHADALLALPQVTAPDTLPAIDAAHRAALATLRRQYQVRRLKLMLRRVLKRGKRKYAFLALLVAAALTLLAYPCNAGVPFVRWFGRLPPRLSTGTKPHAKLFQFDSTPTSPAGWVSGGSCGVSHHDHLIQLSFACGCGHRDCCRQRCQCRACRQRHDPLFRLQGGLLRRRFRRRGHADLPWPFLSRSRSGACRAASPSGLPRPISAAPCGRRRVRDATGVYGAAGGGGAIGKGAQVIVMTNDKGATLELTGRQVGLQVNADIERDGDFVEVGGGSLGGCSSGV